MRIKGTRTVKVAELRTNLFVRKELDWPRIDALSDLIAAGVKMEDPIEVTDMGGENNIVDGRHRKEAFEVNDVKEVVVRVLEFENETEVIAYAYKANAGGAMPPTRSDTEHTVMLLLERNETKKRIGELLGLPTGLARRYANEVESKMARQKLQRAAVAVTDGNLTIAKAAELHGVDADKLKATLSGNRRKTKQGVAEIQRGLTTTYKSLASRNAALLRSLRDKREDGDVTPRQVSEIFKHLEGLQKKSSRAVADWKKRFEVANGKATKSA